MRKTALGLVGCLLSQVTYCQTGKTPLAQNVEAFTSLLWSLLAIVILILLLPHVKKMLDKGNISIKVGNMELNIQQATTQLTKNVLDIDKKLMDLKCELDEATNKKVNIAPAVLKKDWRILWVTENHKSHAFEIAYLERDGVEVLKVSTTKEAIEVLKVDGTLIDAVITGKKTMLKIQKQVWN